MFESASIKACRPESDYDLDALMSRIKELETKLEQGIKVSISNQQLVESPKKEVDTNSQVVEKVSEKPQLKAQTEHLSLSSYTNEDLKGKLLTNLRKIGSEMLWNIMQNVEVSVVGNVLYINTTNSGDFDIIDSSSSRSRIEDALEDFLPFELQVQLSSSEKMMDKLEQEAERVKKIFGDDIVIIK